MIHKNAEYTVYTLKTLGRLLGMKGPSCLYRSVGYSDFVSGRWGSRVRSAGPSVGIKDSQVRTESKQLNLSVPILRDLSIYNKWLLNKIELF